MRSCPIDCLVCGVVAGTFCKTELRLRCLGTGEIMTDTLNKAHEAEVESLERAVVGWEDGALQGSQGSQGSYTVRMGDALPQRAWQQVRCAL